MASRKAKPSVKHGRDAKTGQFITVKEAQLTAYCFYVCLISIALIDNGHTQELHQEASIEQSETYKWLTKTPEGQELWTHVQKSGNPYQVLDHYMFWIAEGETHKQALQAWTGITRRIIQDLKHIPTQWAMCRRMPYASLSQRSGSIFESLSRIQRGSFDLTDISRVLFIPCVIIFIATKREILKLIIGFVWVMGLLVNPTEWMQYLIATLIFGGICYLIRFIMIRLQPSE